MPDTRSLPSVKTMLRIDSAAGFSWGVLVVCLHGQIAVWLGLPQNLILFQAMANFTYAAYSGSLALRDEPPDSMLKFLVFANLAYGLLCFGFFLYFFPVATLLGRVSLVLECLILSSLAAFEYKVFFARGSSTQRSL